ncbi:MAG: polysaccharide biosynthesis/export family protein [Candidatus Zixiibacteriota bacterium]|nr:MAG: polysaccharide biosynthesis/export family protein [candidate division Zixibacteria bacterium]
MIIRQRLCKTVVCVMVLVLGGALSAPADNQYIIGTGDILQISFWQDPQLNAEVRVSEDGKISLDIIGQLDAAGRTTQQLQNEIASQISRLNKNISQAVVRVVEFNYLSVFIIGQVRNPGKRSYEMIPDLWRLINEAGGVTETADLTRVTIVRGGDRAGQVEVVDVQKAVSEGKIASLPAIGRMDTIEIPRTVGASSTPNLALTTDRKNLIYILGAVNDPGVKTFEEGVDILDALAIAGGPSPDADLKHARILMKDGEYSQTMTIDLNKYTSSGRPARYILRKEDTIVLPRRKAGFLGVGLPVAAGVAGLVTSLVIILDRLGDDRGAR